MTAGPGYVYALINYAMPGLVKVGCTTRSPTERLGELSSATGVPSPFELVYDVLVPDVSAAERYVHRCLSDAGYRHAENREFFRAPIRDVLRLLIGLRETMETPTLMPAGVAIPPGAIQGAASERDPLFRDAAECVIQNQLGSTSLLQRKLKVGYGRAVRIIDQLHDAGIVGPPDRSMARRVLKSVTDLDKIERTGSAEHPTH
jgi:hypothetical protein